MEVRWYHISGHILFFCCGTVGTSNQSVPFRHGDLRESSETQNMWLWLKITNTPNTVDGFQLNMTIPVGHLVP